MKKTIMRFLIVGMGLSGINTQAAESQAVICTDQDHSYRLELKISDAGSIGMTYIDFFERDNFLLSCAQVSNTSRRIDFSCISDDLETGGKKKIKVHVHKVLDSKIPRMALLEIRTAASTSGINNVIPLICNP